MKKYLIMFSVFLFVSPLFAQEKMDLKEISKTILGFLNTGEFEKVRSYLDSSAENIYTVQKLEQMWKNLNNIAGAYVKTKETKDDLQSNFTMVTQTLEFQKKLIDLKLMFRKNNKVGTISILPNHTVENYKTPGYYDSTKVAEKEVKIFSREFILTGLLTAPAAGNKFPIVVLVHGSGPNDRDETVGATKMFKDIALGLATKGIAVLRFDKRSKTYTSPIIRMKSNATVKDETIDDVVAAVQSLKTYSSIDTNRIYLLGHSLGAMLLPRIAEQVHGVAGLCMIAGNARPLEDQIYDQSVYLLSIDSMTERKRTLLDTLKAQLNRVKQIDGSLSDTSMTMLLYHQKSYWADLNGYHQSEVAKKLNMPIYILHGERDYQVPMTDFNLWKKKLADKKNVQFKLYPKLNHMFQEGEGKSLPDDYDKLGNVPVYVIDDIVNWISNKKK